MAVGAMEACLQLRRLTATAKGPERVTILREGCFFGFFPQALRASRTQDFTSEPQNGQRTL